MELVLISAVSLGVSCLTLYSGFGLGTLLMPVFALFLPVEQAVGATAIVHGANNVLKVGVFGRSAERRLVVRFGLPAVAAAFAGAALLGYVAHLGEIARYEIGSRLAVVTPVKIVLAVLMLGFALFELLPRFRALRFDDRRLALGGLLSGFFGGLSGHQGALRSAFLAKAEVSPAAFVGTNAVIGLLVDLARLAVYGGIALAIGGSGPGGDRPWRLVVVAVLSAFAGVWVGGRLLHKVTMSGVQKLTGALLFAIALALGAGIV